MDDKVANLGLVTTRTAKDGCKELYEDIMAAVDKHNGVMLSATVLGVIDIVKRDLLDRI